jgi:hypothetical protein
MKLIAGRRLTGPGRSAYHVDGLEAETPWHRLYGARKIFYNFRYDDRAIYEAAEDEWIDVRVRMAAHPEGVLPGEVEKRRGLLRDEATQVLAGAGRWMAQAIDWIEVPYEGEPPGGAIAGRREPALVLSRPAGGGLRPWRTRLPGPTPECLHLCAEAARLLEFLHRRNQCVGAWGPDDFVVDPAGRLFFLASDRVVSAEAPVWLRQFYPPERYPAAFAAPEVLDREGAIDSASDRYTWAALCVYLVTGEEPIAVRESATGCGPSEGPVAQRLNTAMEQLVRSTSDPLPEPPWSPTKRTGDPESTLAERWTDCLAVCLQTAREARARWHLSHTSATAQPGTWWNRLLRRG